MKTTLVCISAGFATSLSRIQKPDQNSEQDVSGSGLADKGYYVYRLSNNDVSFIHEGELCQDWITTDLVTSFLRTCCGVFSDTFLFVELRYPPMSKIVICKKRFRIFGVASILDFNSSS